MFGFLRAVTVNYTPAQTAAILAAGQDAAMKYSASVAPKDLGGKAAIAGQEAARAKAENEIKKQIYKSKPTLVLDPYNRLQPPPRPTGRPDQAAPNMHLLAPTVSSAPPGRGTTPPIRWTTPSSPSPQVTDMQNFIGRISCMSKTDLTALQANLRAEIRALQTQRGNAAINVQRSLLSQKDSHVTQQLVYPKPCGQSSMQRPPTTAMVPEYFGPGPSPGSGLTYARPGGITVNTMNIPITGARGEEVALSAPLLDLYNVYAERGLVREAQALDRQVDQIFEDVAASEAAPAVAPSTVQTARSAYMPQMPTMSAVNSVALETSIAPSSSSVRPSASSSAGPVTASATAAAPAAAGTGKIWLLLVGLGFLGFVSVKKGNS